MPGLLQGVSPKLWRADSPLFSPLPSLSCPLGERHLPPQQVQCLPTGATRGSRASGAGRGGECYFLCRNGVGGVPLLRQGWGPGALPQAQESGGMGLTCTSVLSGPSRV